MKNRSRSILIATVLTLCVTGIPAAQQPTPSVVAVKTEELSLLERPAKLSVDDVTLSYALAELQHRSGVSLVFSPSKLPSETRVSCSCDVVTVAGALDRLLGQTYLRYTEIGSHVLIEPADISLPDPAVRVRYASLGMLAPDVGRRTRNTLSSAMANDEARDAETTSLVNAQQAQGSLRGRVTTTETSQPLPGAIVVVGNTGREAISGADGRYVIGGIPTGTYEVRASLIGYGAATQTVTIAAEGVATADFALKVEAVSLEQVVVVGYGTQTRRQLTGAISSVNARDIESTPAPSVDQLLLGRAPGVQVSTASGQPGAGAAVTIRGGNSISAGNEPLYVIDGVPMTTNLGDATTGSLMTQGMRGFNPVAAVNPQDIESIEVLKDASAAAIYGARAANGVILITTKRGRPGAGSISKGVTFSSYYGVSEVRKRLPLLNATQFAEMVNQAYVNGGQAPKYTPAEIAALGTGTDWQDAIFRSGGTRNYEASFTGGDTNTRYYMSGSLLQDEGIVIGTHMNRGAFRVNLDQEISDKFQFGIRSAFSRSEGQILPHGGNGQEVSSVVLNAILAPPTLAPRDSTGEYFSGINPLTGRPFPNPVATAELITNRERQNRIIGNVFGEYDLLSNLKVRSSIGVDFLNSLQDFYSPSNTLPGRNTNGYGSRGQAQTTSWLNENTISYSRPLTSSMNLDLLGGLTLQRVRSETISGTAQEFQTDKLGVNALNSAGTFVGVWTGAPNSSLLSYFTRANLSIADRYLFTATGRIDGSSKFGEGKRYGLFPSAAFAWRASEEDFVKQMDIFDDLKLRISYGRTGNQDIGNFASLATMNSTVYVFGGERAIGYAAGNLANADLKWETTDQFDAGIDAAFFNRRLGLTFDFYNKKTSDLLLYVPVPSTSGFGSQLQNIGSVRNRGVELSLNTVNLTGRLRWESTLIFAKNNGEVLNLGNDSMIIAPVGVGSGAVQNPTILKVGHPTSAFFGWQYDGLSNGQPVYRDTNGDGAVTGDDRVILGDAQPDFTGGLNNRISLGNFELTVFVQWSVGNEIYNINRALLTAAAGNNNQLQDVATGGDGIPTPKVGNTFDARESDLFIEDGTYLRGKNLRLAYNVPTDWLRRMSLAGLNQLQVYMGAQNFFTITDYSGFDPEINEYSGSSLAQGFDFGTYPQPRQITFGFRAGF